MKVVAKLNGLFPLLICIVLILTMTGKKALGENETSALLQSGVLKYRVQVASIHPDNIKIEQENSFVLKSEGWKTLLLEEGVSIAPDEWSNARDLMKIKVANSNLFRLVNTGLARKEGTLQGESAKLDLSPMVILTRFGTGTNGSRVLFHLIDGVTGNTIVSGDYMAASMEKAVDKAIRALEDEVSLITWRCQVVGIKGNEMIIDRGRLDGLRLGQKLVGYKMAPQAEKHGGYAPEMLIMQFGTRTGIYEISEEGEEFSKAIPVDKAPLLSVGDIFELPAINLPPRQKETRGRRVWDKMYDEQK